jgi:murein DD-endopeptidase MepM/ murein hydrolase activator NlpD
MKSGLLPILLLMAPVCFGQTRMAAVHNPGEAKPTEDDSYIYALPYRKGHSYLLVQAYQTAFSHKGEYALDFKMRRGTKVCAARSGRVVAVREDSKKGGLKPKFLSEGNYVIIKHSDGTYANYWHLKFNGALVNEGDSVEQGQVIALSGNTGYTAFPHLHFEVTTAFTPGHSQIPTRFHTRKGNHYLAPLHWYKSL